MAQIGKQQGIDWVHVPFKGNAETTNALLGGHIHAVADSTGWGPLVNSGKLRLLATWGASRTKSWPNVPTLREAGIDIVSVSPFGLAGPKGMDPAVVKALHEQEGLSVLVVEQNAELALRASQRAYVLEVGRVAVAGASDELRRHESVRRSYLGY